MGRTSALVRSRVAPRGRARIVEEEWPIPGHERFGAVAGPAVRPVVRQADHLRRRGRDRGSRERGERDSGLPAQSRSLQADGRADPPRCAAVRCSWHGQDAARPGGCWRGAGSLLLHLGVGVRRDDCRCRSKQGTRPLRQGQAGGAFDHLHRRTGRHRAGPGRHVVGRWLRREGADPQPDTDRDGRLYRQ